MIGTIYKKELKDSLRDRKTLVMTVLLPLILVLGLNMFMDRTVDPAGLDSFTIAVPAAMEADTQQLLKAIPNADVKPSADPVAEVQAGKAQVAVSTEPGFYQKIMAGGSGEMTLQSDATSMNSDKAQSIVKTNLQAVQASLVAKRLQEKGIDPSLVQPFVFKEENISGQDQSIAVVSYMLPMVVAMMLMLGLFPAAVDLFAGEKERKTIESLLMTPVPRRRLIIAKWLTLSTIGVVSGLIAIVAFFLSIKYFAKHLSLALHFGDNAPLLLLFAVIAIVLTAMLYAGMQMIVSLMAKTFKEAQSYISPVMFLGFLPVFPLFGVSASELSWYYFAVPLLNVVALAKEIIYGTASFAHLGLTVLTSALAIAVVIGVGSWMYGKDRWVLGR